MQVCEQQAAFALGVSHLISEIFRCGYKCTLGESFRSKEQALIYAKQGKGVINSAHCQRLAIDLNLFDSHGKYLTDTKDYELFGSFWENLDPQNRWGGHFIRADGNHFERKLM